jgi:plasmid stabilization system protein ParE
MRDAEEYRAFILSRSHDKLSADAWWRGLFDAIATLETLPARCKHIPEQKRFSKPLHQLLYESHRIIFEIHPKHVQILRVYHSAQRPLTSLRRRPPSTS